MNTKRKPPSSTSDSTKSQELCLPQTHRCLFGFSNRKRKQQSPLTTPYPKRKTSLFSTPLATSTLSSDGSGPPSPSPLDAYHRFQLTAVYYLHHPRPLHRHYQSSGTTITVSFSYYITVISLHVVSQYDTNDLFNCPTTV